MAVRGLWASLYAVRGDAWTSTGRQKESGGAVRGGVELSRDWEIVAGQPRFRAKMAGKVHPGMVSPAATGESPPGDSRTG